MLPALYLTMNHQAQFDFYGTTLNIRTIPTYLTLNTRAIPTYLYPNCRKALKKYPCLTKVHFRLTCTTFFHLKIN